MYFPVFRAYCVRIIQALATRCQRTRSEYNRLRHHREPRSGARSAASKTARKASATPHTTHQQVKTGTSPSYSLETDVFNCGQVNILN